MPNRDGTGPNGKGPRTGRGNGPCKENQTERDSNFGGGRGFGRHLQGRGNGYGRGFGRGRA